MKKTKLYEVKKKTTTNSIGEPITTYEKTGFFIWSDYVLPISNQATINNIRAWGFDPASALETRSRSNIKENAFFSYNDETFHINKVLNYPRFKHAFLERVKEDA